MAAPEADDDSSFSFSPSNDRLVDYYLRAKIDGKISEIANAGYFVDADVCSARPWELVRAHSMPARVQSRVAGDGKQWYFFSPVRFFGVSRKKKSRTIAGTDDKESWHIEGRQESAGGGCFTKFSYHVKNGQALEKPGWIMTEYSIGVGNTVLCKVYRSPRGPGRSKSKASSSSAISGCKRKAADYLELEEAAPRPSTRQSRIEPQNVGESQSQPEPQVVPASVDVDNNNNTVFEALETFLMSDEGEDWLQVPDGLDSGAFFSKNEQQQQEAAVLEHGQALAASQPELPQFVPGSFDALTLNVNLPLPDWIRTPEFEAYCRGLFGDMYDEANEKDAARQRAHGPPTSGAHDVSFFN